MSDKTYLSGQTAQSILIIFGHVESITEKCSFIGDIVLECLNRNFWIWWFLLNLVGSKECCGQNKIHQTFWKSFPESLRTK